VGRRANGEGSIYQRKDGRWAASLSLGNGKRTHFLGHSWDEVHARLLVAKKAQLDGLPPAPEKQTVRQFLLHWQEATGSARKPRTNIRYEELIRLHVLPYIGAAQLQKLTPQQIQGLYSELLRKGLSAATVGQVHAILHRAFKQAVGWTLMYRNPTDYAQRPRVEHKVTQVLSPSQVRALLEAAKGTRFEALFVLAVTTGMREGELLGLRWQDVDLDDAVLHIRHAMQRLEGEWRFVEPKSAKSRRTIALSALAVETVRRHRARQVEERLRMGRHWEDWDLVFCNEMGKPVEVSNLTQRHFRPLLAEAGLPKIRFHDLRHSAATLMLGAKVDVKVVSEMLGHSHTAFTMDRYQHVSQDLQRAAGLAIERMIQA
jgi:integrase